MQRRELERDSEAVIDRVEQRFDYPCFTKPANLGSSVGVSKARNRTELQLGLQQAARYDAKLLVERGIDARELECGVLGNDDPIASVVGEIVAGADFYDYRAKYLDSGSQAIIPADVDPELARTVQRLAVEAFKAVDAAGLARVDFFLDRSDGQLYLNEINTMPGFTEISMYPKLWQASGVSFSELVTRIAELGIERFAERARNQTSIQPRVRRSARVLLAGGGSGGSATPVLAVAQALRQRRAVGRVSVRRHARRTRGGTGGRAGHSLRRRRVGQAAALLGRAQFERSRARRRRDGAVVRAGAPLSARHRLCRGRFRCGPADGRGTPGRSRTLIHQQDVEPGLANRLLVPFADRITVSLASSLAHFPRRRIERNRQPRAPGDSGRAAPVWRSKR